MGMMDAVKSFMPAIISFVLVLLIAYGYQSVSCKGKSISFDDHTYSVFTGCMVKHKGQWLPLDNIRGFD